MRDQVFQMHPQMASLIVRRKNFLPPRNALFIPSHRQANAGPAFRQLAELENGLRSGQALPAVRPPAGPDGLGSQHCPAIRSPFGSSMWSDRGSRARRDLQTRAWSPTRLREAAPCSPAHLSDPLSVFNGLLIPEVRDVETLVVGSSLLAALGTGPPGNHGLQVATNRSSNVHRPPAHGHTRTLLTWVPRGDRNALRPTATRTRNLPGSPRPNNAPLSRFLTP